MYIDSEALESFLNEELKSRCSADPQSLTRYVMALLKKKRKEKELQQTLLEALDVFLGNRTPSFVEMLMEALKTQSYISPTQIPDNPMETVPLVKKVIKVIKSDHLSEKIEPDANERQKERRSPPKESTEKKGSLNTIVPSPPNQGQVKTLCKAYEELGYCLAGNSCSYFHGVDAVVVDDVHDIIFPTPPPPAVMVPHVPPPPLPPTQSFPLPPLPPEPPGVYHTDSVPEAYNPENPSMSQLPISRKRELVVLPHAETRPTHTNFPNKRKAFDFNRLGPKPKIMKSDLGSKIELRNVPPSLNTISHLNSYFAKFGTIVNIEVGKNGSSSSIRFEKQCEAESAFRKSKKLEFDLLYKGEIKARHIQSESSLSFEKGKIIFNKIKSNPKEKNPAVAKHLDLLKKKHSLLNSLIENYKMIAAKMSNLKKSSKEFQFLKETLRTISSQIVSMQNEITKDSADLRKSLSEGGKKPLSMHSEKEKLDAEIDFYHSKSLLGPLKSSEGAKKDLLSDVNELNEKGAKWLGPSSESPLPDPNPNEMLERSPPSEVNPAAISVQEEQQISDILKSDSLLLGDDEEEDEEEDSEARSWRR